MSEGISDDTVAALLEAARAFRETADELIEALERFQSFRRHPAQRRRPWLSVVPRKDRD